MRPRLVFSLSLVFFLSTAAEAQWIPTVPPSGWRIWCLGVNGPDLFAGTTEGLFRSTDDGLLWTAIDSGLSNTYIRSIAVVGGDLFVGTDGSGVFRSSDNGAHWVPANKGFPQNYGITSFATMGTDIFVGTSGGVYRSTDNGDSWFSVSSMLENNRFDAVLVDGTNLFAGCNRDNGGSGVFLSTDRGGSWVVAGMPSLSVTSLLIVGQSSPKLLAGSYVGGAFLANIDGTGWTPVNSGLLDSASGPTITSLVASGANTYGASGAGGVVRFMNESVWEPVNGLPVISVNALAVSSTYIFAAIDSTVWRKPLP